MDTFHHIAKYLSLAYIKEIASVGSFRKPYSMNDMLKPCTDNKLKN